MPRQVCPDCGGWSENPSASFSALHQHPVGAPVVVKVPPYMLPDDFAPIFTRLGLVCHQVAPASGSRVAVFLSRKTTDSLTEASQMTRIVVSSAAELDTLLTNGRPL